jgi:diaminopimelate decarboxylase
MGKKYEKPQIDKIGHPIFSKHGMSTEHSHQVMDSIDSKTTQSLLAQFGSPLFVFSERQLISKFRAAKEAFEKRYSKVTFGWSYKTNYLKAICQVFHREGALAEVVSEFEYEKARLLNVPGDQIIFNGPYKPLAILKRAVQEGARIHIDSIEEITDLEQISRETGVRPKVGIRINLNTGIQPQWSRFGFNLETGQAHQAIERIKKGQLLDLVGLHTHIGTFILNSDAYSIAAQGLSQLASELLEKYGVQIQYVDLGGGFASLNHLKGVYQPPEIAVPKIDEYAEKITSALKEHWIHAELPELVIESGRHLVDEAGYLITSVVSTKLLPDSRRAIVLDGGVNLLYTSTWYKPEVFLGQKETGPMTPTALVGPLCMNIDVVADSLMLPRLTRGSTLILNPVGAYNVTQWMQFIQYRPAVVLIRTNGKTDLIRKRENLEYIDQWELLPEDLELKKS